MLVQCWPSIGPALRERLVFSGTRPIITGVWLLMSFCNCSLVFLAMKHLLGSYDVESRHLVFFNTHPVSSGSPYSWKLRATLNAELYLLQILFNCEAEVSNKEEFILKLENFPIELFFLIWLFSLIYRIMLDNVGKCRILTFDTRAQAVVSFRGMYQIFWWEIITIKYNREGGLSKFRQE